MSRILLDTNVVLDALLTRTPWNVDAEAIFKANRGGQIAAHMTANSLADVFYVARRLTDRPQAWRAIGTCLDQLYILSVGLRESRAAASGTGNDFEDNLQIACATLAGLDAIVTRKDFAGSPIPVLTPAELLAQIAKGADA
jgi:predicted nucleic acid-binding protein